MDIQSNNKIDLASSEALFEQTLKSISSQAFDAMLASGVRDLEGLLCLEEKNLCKLGISRNIVVELLDVQKRIIAQTICKELKNNQKFNDVLGENDNKELEKVEFDSKFATYKTIPEYFYDDLSTRARNALIREGILFCEEILQYKERDLLKIKGVSKKTAYDISQLQKKILQEYPDLLQVCTAQKENGQFDDSPNMGTKPLVSSSLLSQEREPSDPSDWSLLSRTLPDVFQVTPPWHYPTAPESELTIQDLGISIQDIGRFIEIAIFPNDPVEFLFSLSCNHFLQANIGDETLSVLVNYLVTFSESSDRTQIFISNTEVSDRAIFNDQKLNLYEDLIVENSCFLDFVLKKNNTNYHITWGDLLKISERDVISSLGFSINSLKTIQGIWKLKVKASELDNKLLNALPNEAFCSYDHIVDAFVQKVVKNDRDYAVVKGRTGFFDGQKLTLEELGQRENVTRERIRQIEKKLMTSLQKPRNLERLYRLWLAIDETLVAGGGVCCVAEIAKSLESRWRWPTSPSDEALASLIALSANYEVVWAPPIRIIMPNHKCVSCTEIGAVLTRAVESRPNGTLSFEDANAIMHGFCQSQNCDQSSKIFKFSNGYLHFLDDAIEEILADDTALYTQYAWGIKYGMRRTALVERIVYEAGRPMHFKEVHAEVNKDRPAHGQLSDRSIYGNLERSPSLLLWGPGTFMHRDLVKIPETLITEIENDVILRLKTHNIPFLSITGIFEEYKVPLLAKCIPNAHALYSCMRITNNHELDCPDYPYVLKRGSGVQRLPIPLVLEAFVLEQEGVVTLDQIKSFAIEKMCVNEAVFMVSHLPSIPNLLRINSGEYIHIRQFGIDKDQLASIIDHLKKLLENYEHVSARKVFDDKKITCKLLGISTPMLLFSLIQLFYSDRFDLSRYPQIRSSAVDTDENRTAGVALEVINYIRNKVSPCSFVELYQHFVEELGYKQASVHNVLYTYKNILRYSEGVIIHLESLAWTEEKQTGLEKLAISHLDSRDITGKPFGLISYLYEYMHDQLPELPVQIAWTPTLIGELLSREGKFAIVGTPRDAYVSIPNSHDIETLDDLLYFILCAEYDGAASIDHFVSDMRDAGILKKSLTPMMLGEDSRVVIDGNVVHLAGLSDRVERA